MEKLTKVEEEIMQIIWQLERCTVRDVIDSLNQKPAPPHSTISSVVRILEKKGFLDHKAYGRTYEYFPIISKEEYSKRSVSSLVQNYFGGSVKRLVSFLVKKENLSTQDINDMIQQLEDSDQKPTNND
ncbi:MAG: BlaI/MecI/CopY family transcriptional regulator [Aureispira sp.]|nr:BlaI/MecI/CopY family transcriptional regulator [Aureispira sp.]